MPGIELPGRDRPGGSSGSPLEGAGKTLIYRWWFKLLLILCFFVPVYTSQPINFEETSSVVAAILARPFAYTIGWLIPVTKGLLLAVVLLPLLYSPLRHRLLLGYYAVMLLIVGIFQNTASTTEYGLAWMIGNTILQLIVLAFCIADVVGDKSVLRADAFERRHLWVVPLMALALLMPYRAVDDRIVADLGGSLFTSESGLTYCMITPVVLGMLILFQRAIHEPTMHVIAFVGLLFGIINIVMWFVINPQDWWMGVLHFPLLFLSLFALYLSRRGSGSQPRADRGDVSPHPAT